MLPPETWLIFPHACNLLAWRFRLGVSQLELLPICLAVPADAAAADAAAAASAILCRRRWLLCAPIMARLYLDVLSLHRSSCKRHNHSPRTSNYTTSSALQVSRGWPGHKRSVCFN
jgi:hypothetical protein